MKAPSNWYLMRCHWIAPGDILDVGKRFWCVRDSERSPDGTIMVDCVDGLGAHVRWKMECNNLTRVRGHLTT